MRVENDNYNRIEFAYDALSNENIKCFHQLFEEWVEKTPNAIALVYKGEKLTYKSLDDRANKLAYLLRRYGVNRREVVAIICKRSIEMIVAVLAISKAGAIFTTIDSTFPANRVNYILKDAKVKLLLHYGMNYGILSNIRKMGVETWDLSEINKQYVEYNNEYAIERVNNPRDLFCILYTSGTTGEPKGVMIDHTNTYAHKMEYEKNIGLTSQDRVLQFASCTFVVFLAEMSMSLLQGAQLHIIDEDIRHDIPKLEEYINENKITSFIFPPGLCAQLNLKKLKRIFAGGAVTTNNMINKNQESDQFINTYGSTECGLITKWVYNRDEEIPQIIPIGKPVWGKKVYIIKEGKICKVNETGEICVAGYGVARGYFNKQELTDKKFTISPYCPGDIYHTGDLGRWLDDGNIEYLGRMDDQIKSGGNRVEPMEIENAIRKFPLVEDAVVFSRKVKDDETICAFFTGKSKINVLELLEYISTSLPRYMLPAYIKQIGQIPKNKNGKVDKNSLLKLIEYRTIDVDENLSKDECIIIDIFKDILKLKQISREDNFFHIGGNSLSALMVLNRIEKSTGIRLTMGDFFNNNTSRKLAKHMYKTGVTGSSNVRLRKKEYYLMSSVQKRMYILNEVENVGLAYNNPMCFKIPQAFQIEKLYETFVNIIERNEIFRTIFYIEDGEYRQKVEEHINIDFEHLVVDKSINHIIFTLIKPFSMSRGPLLRMKVLECVDGKYLFFDFHHIIFDGLSKEIFLNEFSKLYNGDKMEEQRFQFTDYSEWLNEKDLSKQKEYWLTQFKDKVPKTSIICDYQRPIRKTYDGKCLHTYLSTKLENEIKNLTRDTETTESMLLLSCFMVLMSKYSGQEDIVIGMPISGRTQKETEGIMGMFVNTLVLRGKPEKEKTFSEFLKEIKETAIKAYENQEYPFEELVEKVEVARDFSRNPLFDIMFVVQNMDHESLFIEGKKCKEIYIERNYSKFDLTLQIENECDRIKVELEYCTDLFKTESAKSILAHYLEIIKKIVENPEARIDEIEVVTEADRKKILEEFNNTDAEYPRDKTIVDLFEEQVGKTPNNVAVMFDDESITYEELNRKSNVIGHKLGELGVRQDEYVAIIAERSIEMVVGIYGVLKAGGAYVPIDPNYPMERIQYMLEDCKPKAVLLYKAEVNTDIPMIDMTKNGVWEGVSTNPKKISKPEDLAYLIYTSGTTGRPKGVMIENRNVVRLVKNTKFQFDFNRRDVWMMFHSFCFDFSVWELFGSTLYGASLVIISREDAQDAFKVATIIKDKKITILNQVPSAFYNLMQIENEQMKSVRYLIFGGEALKPDKLKDWHERYPNAKIINMYGITETTVHVTYKEISTLEIQHGISDIGMAIPTLKVYIMNKGVLCGIGMPGELCVAGDGVARGYLNNPELTAKKFVKNPFGEGRIYRSGDLARLLPNGNIEYIGRIDEQFKLRGFRIELGEIESTIRRQEGVKDVAVIAREKNGDKHLFAYIVGEKKLDMKKLRDGLKKELPEYMIPSYQTQIEQLPITRNGKLDKKALPEIEIEIMTEYMAPRNETEEKIAKIFGEILGLKRVSIDESFFDMGGHSLRATKLANKIEAEIGVKLTIKNIFQNPTVSELAMMVDNSRNNRKYEGILKAEKKESYRMSSNQKRLYAIQQMEGGTLYNMPKYAKINGDIDERRLREVFDEMLKRHEILRTCLKMKGDEPVQIVKKVWKADFSVIREPKKCVNEIFKKFIRPFKLEQGNVIRMQVAEAKEGKYIMIDMHHVVSDGISMGIFMKEFSDIYNGKKLEQKHLQYVDYSEWMNTRDLKAQREYWLKQYETEIPILDIPLDYPRSQKPSRKGKIISLELPSVTEEGFKKISKETGCTNFMTLLSCLMIMMSKYSGLEDIVIGTAVNGRTHKDTEEIMGMFVNTVPLKGKPERCKTCLEFLREMRETTLKAFENQEYPFEELVDEIGVTRDFSRNPLFDVMFIMQNNEDQKVELNGVHLKWLSSSQVMSKFDLTFNAYKYKGRYVITLEYCTDLFKTESAESILAYYSEIIKKIVENPKACIGEIEIVTDEDKRKILKEFNNTNAEYPSDRTIVDLFEEQVGKTPNNTAIIFKDESITYEELNRRSNVIGHKLRKLGVGRNEYVAIIAERSIEMVVGIYGVLKAGGVYVPIDPNYPMERIQYMIEDCKPKTVLLYKAEINMDIPMINMTENGIWEGVSTNPKNISKPEDLAYLIYTSGTTGKPKGVMVTNRNVVNYCHMNNKNVFGGVIKKEIESILSITSICFDIFVTESLLVHMHGMKMILASDRERNSVSELGKLVKKYSIEVLQITPSMLKLYLETAESNEYLSEFKTILIGGESISYDIYAQLKQYTDARIYNVYGPSETTVWVTIKDMSASPTVDCIGKPIENVCVYIMNNQMLCGIGMPGELCIAGDAVTKGYLNYPELTDEKFEENPFGEGRMYRTGDLARWLHNGNIQYLGRIDEQVKIHGFRIESGEIENVIRKQKGVKDVAVIAREKNGDKHLVAYIVGEVKLDMKKLRDAIMMELPEYMIPSYQAQIEQLPVTRNGKLDKKALPEIEVEMMREYLAPRNEVEEKIAEIFGEILGLERVSIDESIFYMGADSIKVIRMVSRMKKIGYDISVTDIFENKTIEKIAMVCKKLDTNRNIEDTHYTQKEEENISTLKSKLNDYNDEEIEGFLNALNELT